MDIVVKCRKFNVCQTPVTTKSGATVQYDVIDHPGGVVILPFVGNDKIALIRQERVAVGEEIWELPAGTLDVPGEKPRAAALRELEEEIGYKAKSMRHLRSFFTSPGFLNEVLHAYIARDLVKTKQNLTDGEELSVHILDFSKATDMVMSGEIVDAKTILVILHYAYEDADQRWRDAEHRSRKRVITEPFEF